MCFGSISLCTNAVQFVLGSSDTSREVQDTLLSIQVILGTTAYLMRKFRFARPAFSKKVGRRITEVGLLVASTMCGFTVAESHGVIPVMWTVGAYALAGTNVTKRREDAFTNATQWFREPPEDDVSRSWWNAKRRWKDAQEDATRKSRRAPWWDDPEW